MNNDDSKKKKNRFLFWNFKQKSLYVEADYEIKPESYKHKSVYR